MRKTCSRNEMVFHKEITNTLYKIITICLIPNDDVSSVKLGVAVMLTIRKPGLYTRLTI